MWKHKVFCLQNPRSLQADVHSFRESLWTINGPPATVGLVVELLVHSSQDTPGKNNHSSRTLLGEKHLRQQNLSTTSQIYCVSFANFLGSHTPRLLLLGYAGNEFDINLTQEFRIRKRLISNMLHDTAQMLGTGRFSVFQLHQYSVFKSPLLETTSNSSQIIYLRKTISTCSF